MQIKINGDDFGIHHEVNIGIINAFRRGNLTSASLMVNYQAAAEAVEIAKKTPIMPVGLHLNISSGFCVAPKAEVHSLVNQDGRFLFDGNNMPDSIRRLRSSIADNPLVLLQVEREFRAQVARFREFGLELDHLDIHHYLSLIHIDLFESCVKMAKDLGVPFRGLCYPILDMMHVPEEVVEKMRRVLLQSGQSTAEISLGNLVGSKPAVLPSPADYQEAMENKLLLLSSEGIQSVELVTHPVNFTDFVRTHDTYFWARSLETTLVMSGSFREFLTNHGFKLTKNIS